MSESHGVREGLDVTARTRRSYARWCVLVLSVLGEDGRLDRLCETTMMIMEAFQVGEDRPLLLLGLAPRWQRRAHQLWRARLTRGPPQLLTLLTCLPGLLCRASSTSSTTPSRATAGTRPSCHS